MNTEIKMIDQIQKSLGQIDAQQKKVSKSSLGILSAASSLKNSIICFRFNRVTSNPCLSKFVMLEQSIEATKFGAG